MGNIFDGVSGKIGLFWRPANSTSEGKYIKITDKGIKEIAAWPLFGM
jgi:hypothetical protein